MCLVCQMPNICNGTDTNGKNLAHIEHLMGGVFCAWCAKCAKYLAFGTSAVGALMVGVSIKLDTLLLIILILD